MYYSPKKRYQYIHFLPKSKMWYWSVQRNK